MQHDIEIIPGTSGTVGHELGLVLNYKIPASGEPVDLSGAELVFIASAGGSAVLTKATPDITWASETGQIVVPFSVENTRALGAHSYLKYTLERREGAAQRLILYGQINVTKVYNDD